MKPATQAQARRYRAWAAQFRQEAASAADDVTRQQLLELAIQYDWRAEAAEQGNRRS